MRKHIPCIIAVPWIDTCAEVPRAIRQRAPSQLREFPNPSMASVTIEYRLTQDEHVTLKVFTILGEEIATLADSPHRSGSHSVTYTLPQGVGSGTFLYHLYSGKASRTGTVVIRK